MLGITIIPVKARKAYTIEELYEIVKGVSFEAGEPELLHYGLAQAICFPEQDRNNQVQISCDKKGKISVLRSTQPMSAQKVAKNLALDQLTGGLSGMSILGGKKKRLCEELAKKTAQQLNEMDL